MDFREETVDGLATMVARKEVSARELVSAALERIEATNESINAFVAIDGEAALADADAIDQRVANGDEVGPLAGVPIGVKDMEDAQGFVTTKGSRMFAADPAAIADSLFVERLRDAGCVVVGKTNTPELAWTAETTNKVFGRTANPWDTTRSPGGSSGGSAAAVAAGQVPMATGSDGGGSIRIPAALCGLTGMKPSLGRVPIGGQQPPGWADLSVKGPIARTARDAALILDAVIGPDPSDLRALPMPEQSWLDALDDLHTPRRVVWSPTLGYALVDPEVRAVCEQAVARLEDAGTEVLCIDDVFAADPGVDWLKLAVVANLRTIEDRIGADGDAWSDIDDDLAAMVRWARDHTSAQDVLRAQDLAHRLNLKLVDLFHQAPFLLTPTVAGQTPLAGEFGRVDGVEHPQWVAFTYPFNLTRSPAGTVCAGFTSDGMPVGLQVVGPQHADAGVLRLLAVLEEALELDAVCPLP